MSNISNLRPWPKGQSGNPGGKLKLPEALRNIRHLTPIELCKIVSKYARMKRKELQIAVEDQDTPMIDLAIASIFAQSAKNGDYQRLAFLLDRTVGKVPDMIEDDEDRSEREELAKLSLNELLTLVKTNFPNAGAPE